LTFAIAGLCLASAAVANAQLVPGPTFGEDAGTGPAPEEIHGFTLGRISVAGGYSSQVTPFGLTQTVTPQAGDAFLRISGGLAWRHLGRSSYNFRYTPAYMRRFKFSDNSALSQTLSFSTGRSLAPRLNWTFGVTGADMSSDQLAFSTANEVSNLTVPTTFDQFLSGVLGGRFTNDQVASLLTGTVLTTSPLDPVLYGRRSLTTGAATGLSYSISPRASVSFNVNASMGRWIRENGSSTDSNANIPGWNKGVSGSLGLSYDLSSRTFLTVSGTAAHRFNASAYSLVSTSVTAGLTRILWANWVVSANAGAVRTFATDDSALSYTARTRPVASANIGWKSTGPHSFTFSYTRPLMDSYGFGGNSSIAKGGWRWHPAMAKWGVGASVSQSRITGSNVISATGTTGSISFMKMLNNRIDLSAGYAFSTAFRSYQGSRIDYSRQNVFVGISFSTFPMFLQEMLD
jgi:hypothetical protein